MKNPPEYPDEFFMAGAVGIEPTLLVLDPALCEGLGGDQLYSYVRGGGGRNRTHVTGFGDQCPTIERRPLHGRS